MVGKKGGGSRPKKPPATVSGIAENRMNRMQRAAIGTRGRAGTAEDYGSYSTTSKKAVKIKKPSASKIVKGAVSAARTVKKIPKSRTAKKEGK